MQSSSREDFAVSDSKEEDKFIESDPKAIPGNPNPDTSSVTKLDFLESFARGSSLQETEINDGLSADSDGKNGSEKCNDCGSYAVGSPKGDLSIQERTFLADDIMLSTSMNSDVHAHASQDIFGCRNLVPGCLRMDTLAINEVTSSHNRRLDCVLPELPSDQEKLVDVISDDDESLEASSPPTSSSDSVENKDAMEHLTPAYSEGYVELNEGTNAEVIITPDFLYYGDKLSDHSQLIFSPDYVKLEYLNTCGSNERVCYQWAVDDIFHIECQWSESVETGLVRVRLRPTSVTGIQNICGTSDIGKLTFGISDPQWQEKEQKIATLTARYKAIWNSILDVADQEDDFMGQNSMFFLKRFFASIDEPFEDVIYPEGDPDAVSISKRDVELLQPETFINDTIIDFYIKYLKNKIQPEDKQRFHFFNSFFFRKLADLDKDPGSAKEGRAAFLRVRKWTRKVNIFEKDYIFIPVNFNLHWSLIVVCHPGEVAYFKDEEMDKASKVPCILHMDSIKGSHTGLKNLVQSYLWEEWKERHGESSEDLSIKFSNLRFVHLELPQQENSFDCGLFLLHYVELFLDEAPDNFNPFKIANFSSFLNIDWFPPFEASHKRSVIHKLIFELLNEHCRKIPLAARSSQDISPKFQEINDRREQAVEFISEQSSPAKKRDLSNSFCSTANGGIEIELLTSTSPGRVQCDKESGIVFREFLDPGDMTVSSLDARCETFHHASFQKLNTALSPIEEDVETGEQFVFSPPDRVGCKLQVQMTSEACPPPNPSSDVESLGAPWSQEIQMQPIQYEARDASSESLSCGSQNSLGAGVDSHAVTLQNRDFGVSNEQAHETEEKARLVWPETVGGEPENPAVASGEVLDAHSLEEAQVEDDVGGEPENPAVASGEVLDARSLEDVQEEDDVENKENQDSLFLCQQDHPSPSHPGIETTEDSKPSVADSMQLSSEGLEEESEQQAPKRLKLGPHEVERRHTRSMARDCQE